MIERICMFCLIIIIKSKVWTVTHCLGLGHETLVCAVCLTVLLCTIVFLDPCNAHHIYKNFRVTFKMFFFLNATVLRFSKRPSNGMFGLNNVWLQTYCTNRREHTHISGKQGFRVKLTINIVLFCIISQLIKTKQQNNICTQNHYDPHNFLHFV